MKRCLIVFVFVVTPYAVCDSLAPQGHITTVRTIRFPPPNGSVVFLSPGQVIDVAVMRRLPEGKVDAEVIASRLTVLRVRQVDPVTSSLLPQVALTLRLMLSQAAQIEQARSRGTLFFTLSLPDDAQIESVKLRDLVPCEDIPK
jgi:hypothetical protein